METPTGDSGETTGYYANTGQSYTVQFKNDKRHGYGHSKWRDEIVHYEQWKESIREGYEFLKWQNGDEYDGEWKDNKITGVRIYK